MPKDKQETRKRILEAVGHVLTHSGMANIGINSIAQQAGVDKVLIYRYFGSLDDLLRAYIEQTELWPPTSDLLGEKVRVRSQSDVKDMIRELLVNQLNQIRRRKVTQEVLRWETIEENVLTRSLSAAREKQIADILNSVSINKQPTKDLEALLALISSGITYLVLRSKLSDKFLGIDLRSNFGWQRLSKLLDEIVAAYLNSSDSTKT
jgi:AcrR family transcriptional regulator